MSEAKYQFRLISSLEKMFFSYPHDIPEHRQGSMLKNEIYSFQLVMSMKETNDWDRELRIEVNSDLKKYITMYELEYVPSKLPAYITEFSDDDFITKTPGLFPDVLKKMNSNTIKIKAGRFKTVWFEIKPNSEMSGTFNIPISIYDGDILLDTLNFNIEIMNCELPKQTLINTCWFHGDCIAALHNTEIGTDKYYELLDKYLEVYTKFGHNMILTPVFTPPLDTEVGAERPTNQLVDVTINNGIYEFGFEKLDNWIDMCYNHGIRYFEISHLFTQWGAVYTPKIMATVDGEYKRIFGWDVEALSDEYTQFLNKFLPELVDFLKNKGVYNSCYFHISDEPNESHTEQYQAVSEMVKKHVGFEHMIEAISDYVFYEKGLINIPIPSNDHIRPFLGKEIENLWTYYCCIQGNKVANRFMAMPSYRNRILGYQLYKYDIKGFLQWGFNFWFARLSKGVINPYLVTDAGEEFPSGDAFVVYPTDENGEIPVSLRLYVFNEGLQDMRALQLLESMTDKQTVYALLNEISEFDEYPHNAQYILELREKVNRKIADCMEV